jgi:cytidylate kinase
MLNQRAQQSKEAAEARARKIKLRIAIDGPAGAGKSTVARRVAERLSYLYIDTGAMYRAATLIVTRRNIRLSDNERAGAAIDQSEIALLPPDERSSGRQRILIDGADETENIRTREITNQVSAVSALPAVRERMVAKQRQMAEKGAVVLDGRDIGTVVLPDADIKVFLTASPELRAERRLKELQQSGQSVDFQTILQETVERDRKDSTRTIAPLKQAEDAVVVDSDNLSIEEVVKKILDMVIEKID